MRNFGGRPSGLRNGFTLVELLVVIVIIGMLMAFVLPAVQASRGAARRAQSANNLRQIGQALHNFESAKQHYPPSWYEPATPSGNTVDGWSIHALLLPYLEESKISDRIDYSRTYTDYTGGLLGDIVTADNTVSRLSAMRVPVYVSPDEPRDEPRLKSGVPTHYPLNYAANLGTFLVWDPDTGEVGNGAFAPGKGFKAGAFARDGMTHTIAFAEVKAWQPYGRNNGEAADNTNLANILAAVTPDADGRMNAPASLSDLQTLVQAADGAGNFKTNSGHTEWVDGRAHQIGFTTVFGPNQNTLVDVKGDGSLVDVDWTNWQEGKNRGPDATSNQNPTFAAVTARSYREEGVLVLLMGGGVQMVSPDINVGAWRAYSTRNGNELIAPDEQLR